MATGNNKKHVAMQANKGSTSMVVEPFSKKERSDVKPARIINHRDVGQTSTRRQGPRIPRACRNCRVLDPSLDDLMESDKCVTYSVELRCDGITNRDCLKAFHGTRLTIDTYLSLIKKRASLVQAHADVKTAEGHGPGVLHWDDITEDEADQEDESRAAAAEDPEHHDRDDDGGCCLEGPQRPC